MKTNKLTKKTFHLESLLAIAGWTLAIFVSLLYLREVKGKSIPGNLPNIAPKTQASPPESSERVLTLLLESRAYLAADSPERAINRITTLWSVCHSSHETVPPESHEIFAQAVSHLSDAAAQKRNRPVQIIRPERQVPAQPINVKSDESNSLKPVNSNLPKKRTGTATFELPSKNYPTAKKTKPSKGSKAKQKAPKPHREHLQRPRPGNQRGPLARRNPGYPEPPRARQDRRRGQRQGPRAGQNPGFPPPPPRARRGGSFPPYDNPPPPSSPPGY